MGICDRPIARGSPWHNGYVERLIGSIRRECLDHIVVWARHTCDGRRGLTPATTTMRGHIDPWIRMRPERDPFSSSDALSHRPFSAAFTVNTPAFEFSVKTALTTRRPRRG